MTYFGILVSDCMVRIQKPECRVLVVMDHELGTNDCRGWISQALFRDLQTTHKSDLLKREIERLTKIHPNLTTAEIHSIAERNVRHSVIPPGAFYQFRLAFERTQAKGSFKVMTDKVAERLDADIILPASSVKPEYKGKPTLLKWLTGSARTFRGPVVLGIRDVSRTLEFRASYTLVEHAPADSMELEIKPYALAEIEKVRAAFEGREFESLMELLGTSEAQAVIGVDDDQSFDPDYIAGAGAGLLGEALRQDDVRRSLWLTMGTSWNETERYFPDRTGFPWIRPLLAWLRIVCSQSATRFGPRKTFCPSRG